MEDLENKNINELIDLYCKHFDGEVIPIDRQFTDNELKRAIIHALTTNKRIKYGSEMIPKDCIS